MFVHNGVIRMSLNTMSQTQYLLKHLIRLRGRVLGEFVLHQKYFGPYLTLGCPFGTSFPREMDSWGLTRMR